MDASWLWLEDGYFLNFFSMYYIPYLAWSYLSLQTFPGNPYLQQYAFKNVENCHILVHCYPLHFFLQHCYMTELPKLLTIPSLYSHGAILPSTS